MRKKRNRDKKPVIPQSIPIRKIPHYLGIPNLESRHIAWRFSNADMGGPYSCGAFSHDDLKALWDNLRAFERMNPAEFNARQSFHGVPITSISTEAKSRLVEIKLDDLDVIYSFHIMGACRLWCMKHENILSILWWDRDHKVYPTPKKHT